jgi:spore maturation protein CgeB
MKILFSTCRNPDFETITEYIEYALRGLGHEVLWFDDRDYKIPGRLRARFPFLEKFDLGRMNKRLVRVAQKWKPDLILEAGGERILPGALQTLHGLGVKTALWTIDALRPGDRRPALAEKFDYVFCGGTEMLMALQGRPLRRPPVWLPFACDPARHHPVQLSPHEQERYSCDIAFVGSLHPSLYPHRIAMLEAVADLNLGIWGPGAEDLPASSPLKKCVRGGKTGPGQWMKIYSAAKINLCAHYVPPVQDIASNQISPRVYEVAACGGFILCDARRDLPLLFTPGVEAAVGATPREMREQALYYLAHDDERKAIAAAGRERAMAEHSYRHRLQKLLSVVNTL